jgi:hypothetical protein
MRSNTGRSFARGVTLQRRPLGAAARELVEPAEGADHLLPHSAAVVAADLLDQLEIGGGLGAFEFPCLELFQLTGRHLHINVWGVY